MTLWENIRRIRGEKGLSLKALDAASGIDGGNLSRIERGLHPGTTAPTLEKIAGALGVTVAELWVDEDGESVTVE